MNGEDSMNALLEKTDALIAKHREPKETNTSLSDATLPDAGSLPKLTHKLSPEQAFELIKQSALQVAQETEQMQKVVDQDAPKIPAINEVDPWDDADDVSIPPQNAQVFEDSNFAAESFFKSAALSEPSTPAVSASPVTEIDARALAEQVAPELAQLVAELTKEVSSAVFRQMQSGLQGIIENRIRAVVEDAVKQANNPPKT